MDREQFGKKLDDILDNCENLIIDYCKNNEELMKQSILLFRRSTRLIKFTMYSQDRNEIMPIEIVEREKRLINEATNEILNEIKRTNNKKKYNQDNELD